jgi:protein-S-isoprenylcysteine O-methyltransferase Ste14
MELARSWAERTPGVGFLTAFGLLTAVWIFTEAAVGRIGFSTAALRSDRGSAFVSMAGVALGLALACPSAVAGWLPVTAAWVRWLGLVVMACGLAVRVLAILWLGPLFSRFVEIQPGHRLVTNGPYRFARHPSYSGHLLLCAGVGLALGDWAAALSMVVLPTASISYRIMVEERALLSAFGEEYRRYRRNVRCLVPFLI